MKASYSTRRFSVLALLAATGALGGSFAAAQQSQIYAYPTAGQSQEAQSRDRFECHQWAVAQTGFDPTTVAPLPVQPSPPPPPPNYGYSDAPQRETQGSFLGLGNGGMFKGGGMVGDAATGAALGAAGGALAGNAGKGAAIGALATTVFGAVSRSSSTASSPPPQQPNYDSYQQQQYQQSQAQANQAYQERLTRSADYNQAYGACMKARHYTVD